MPRNIGDLSCTFFGTKSSAYKHHNSIHDLNKLNIYTYIHIFIYIYIYIYIEYLNFQYILTFKYHEFENSNSQQKKQSTGRGINVAETEIKKKSRCIRMSMEEEKVVKGCDNNTEGNRCYSIQLNFNFKNRSRDIKADM